MGRLKGKTAVIAGAHRDAGRGAAEALAVTQTESDYQEGRAGPGAPLRNAPGLPQFPTT